MDAFLFTVAIFLFFSIVGFGVVTLFRPTTSIIQGILVAPALGLATTLVFVFFLNRVGLPVKDFGLYLCLGLLLFSAIIFVLRRPIFPLKLSLPYAVVLFFTLLLSAWPMLWYGFDWVSFANDDMANYCLAAERFLNEGFFQDPDIKAIFEGKNYPDVFWFMHVSSGVRPGSELMLAFIWSVTGFNAHMIFMPVIACLNLVLCCSAGAMVAWRGQKRMISLTTMALLSISSMSTLGMLYQLIGQVGGLAIFFSSFTLALQPQENVFKTKLPRPATLFRILPTTICLCSLIIWYPETLPFFGLSWIAYICYIFIYMRKQAIALISVATFIGVVILVFMNSYVLYALNFMFAQSFGGLKPTDLNDILFPYFLVPSGIPNIWGISPISGGPREPMLSAIIFVGIVLTFYFLKKQLFPALKQGLAVAYLCLVMAMMFLLLFSRTNDFGLFKLSMYIQASICGVIASQLFIKTDKINLYWRYGTLAVFIIFNLVIQFGYVSRSSGEDLGSLTEIPHSSKLKINQKFHDFVEDFKKVRKPEDVLLSDTSNVVMAKFEAFYTNQISVLFPARDFFNNLIYFFFQNMFFDKSNGISALIQLDTNIINSLSFADSRKSADQFELREISGNKFIQMKPKLCENKNCQYIHTLINFDIFNNYRKAETQQDNFFYIDKSISNFLIFQHSEKGPHYYSFGSFGRSKTAFFQLEDDPMMPSRQISALGRNILFQIVAPSKNPLIVMEITNTLLKQFDSSLPMPIVQGITLPFKGRGSARVFSLNVTPTWLDGNNAYISIDMNREAKKFPDTRTGLMLLYGRKIPQDLRNITTFGRDISLVTQEQYDALTPPDVLTNFPKDLANKNLEYSGIYEDGWISESSFFTLQQKPGETTLEIKGDVPFIGNKDFKTTLRIKLDGVEIAKQKLDFGPFDIKIPVAYKNQRQRVDLDFDNYQVLPGDDGRPAGAIMQTIGFVGNQPS